MDNRKRVPLLAPELNEDDFEILARQTGLPRSYFVPASEPVGSSPPSSEATRPR